MLRPLWPIFTRISAAPPFDAEEAGAIVGSVFGDVELQRWDERFFPLQTREEVRAYCRHNYIPAARAETAELPLWLTKRGVLVRATKKEDGATRPRG
jgi:hypothetical protein